MNERRRTADPDAGALAPIGLESRHTCASVLIASGANPKVVQRIMGHATIAMMFDTYGGHLCRTGSSRRLRRPTGFGGRTKRRRMKLRNLEPR